jgi:hypothetical protein
MEKAPGVKAMCATGFTEEKVLQVFRKPSIPFKCIFKLKVLYYWVMIKNLQKTAA